MRRSKRVPESTTCAGALFILAAAGCGGAAGASGPGQAPAGATSSESDPQTSIGESAVNEGGMPSLGEAATEGAPSLAGSLQATLLDKKTRSRSTARLANGQRARGVDGCPGEPASASGVVTFAGALQYDEQNLYVACETNDARIDAKDHCSLTIAFPGAGGALVGHEIAFFPGKPGVGEGRVLFASGKRGQAVPGPKIVEAPRSPGLSIEAVLPWNTFAEAHSTRIGLRGF